MGGDVPVGIESSHHSRVTSLERESDRDSEQQLSPMGRTGQARNDCDSPEYHLHKAQRDSMSNGENTGSPSFSLLYKGEGGEKGGGGSRSPNETSPETSTSATSSLFGSNSASGSGSDSDGEGSGNSNAGLKAGEAPVGSSGSGSHPHGHASGPRPSFSTPSPSPADFLLGHATPPSSRGKGGGGSGSPLLDGPFGADLFGGFHATSEREGHRQQPTDGKEVIAPQRRSNSLSPPLPALSVHEAQSVFGSTGGLRPGAPLTPGGLSRRARDKGFHSTPGDGGLGAGREGDGTGMFDFEKMEYELAGLARRGDRRPEPGSSEQDGRGETRRQTSEAMGNGGRGRTFASFAPAESPTEGLRHANNYASSSASSPAPSPSPSSLASSRSSTSPNSSSTTIQPLAFSGSGDVRSEASPLGMAAGSPYLLQQPAFPFGSMTTPGDGLQGYIQSAASPASGARASSSPRPGRTEEGPGMVFAYGPHSPLAPDNRVFGPPGGATLPTQVHIPMGAEGPVAMFPAAFEQQQLQLQQHQTTAAGNGLPTHLMTTAGLMPLSQIIALHQQHQFQQQQQQQRDKGGAALPANLPFSHMTRGMGKTAGGSGNFNGAAHGNHAGATLDNMGHGGSDFPVLVAGNTSVHPEGSSHPAMLLHPTRQRQVGESQHPQRASFGRTGANLNAHDTGSPSTASPTRNLDPYDALYYGGTGPEFRQGGGGLYGSGGGTRRGGGRDRNDRRGFGGSLNGTGNTGGATLGGGSSAANLSGLLANLGSLGGGMAGLGLESLLLNGVSSPALKKRVERDPDILAALASATPSLEEILKSSTVQSLSQDQVGCRFLQLKLDEAGADAATIIFQQAKPCMAEMMTDPFGNYLFQKILDKTSEQERATILSLVQDELVSGALNLHGTRSVQRILEVCKTKDQVATITAALRHDVVRLCVDANGNHVVQRALQHLGSEDRAFIFEAVSQACLEVSTHRHGCCVMQRCLDAATPFQRRALVAEIGRNCLQLMQDPYGNYVVQYVLDRCAADEIRPVTSCPLGRITSLSVQKYSSNVVEKCLEKASEDIQSAYIDEMCAPGNIKHLMQDQYANYVVQRALSVATHSRGLHLVEAVRPHLHAMRNTAGGRRILSKITKRFPNVDLGADMMAGGGAGGTVGNSGGPGGFVSGMNNGHGSMHHPGHMHALHGGGHPPPVQHHPHHQHPHQHLGFHQHRSNQPQAHFGGHHSGFR